MRLALFLSIFSSYVILYDVFVLASDGGTSGGDSPRSWTSNMSEEARLLDLQRQTEELLQQPRMHYGANIVVGEPFRRHHSFDQGHFGSGGSAYGGSAYGGSANSGGSVYGGSVNSGGSTHSFHIYPDSNTNANLDRGWYNHYDAPGGHGQQQSPASSTYSLNSQTSSLLSLPDLLSETTRRLQEAQLDTSDWLTPRAERQLADLIPPMTDQIPPANTLTIPTLSRVAPSLRAAVTSNENNLRHGQQRTFNLQQPPTNRISRRTPHQKQEREQSQQQRIGQPSSSRTTMECPICKTHFDDHQAMISEHLPGHYHWDLMSGLIKLNKEYKDRDKSTSTSRRRRRYTTRSSSAQPETTDDDE